MSALLPSKILLTDSDACCRNCQSAERSQATKQVAWGELQVCTCCVWRILRKNIRMKVIDLDTITVIRIRMHKNTAGYEKCTIPIMEF